LNITHPIDPIIDSNPQWTSVSIYRQYKYHKAEYQDYNVTFLICKDKCGNFLFRKPFTEESIPNSQSIEILERWYRDKYGAFGEAVGPNFDPLAPDEGWINF